MILLWLPLATWFFQGWRNRKNPVSLAICLTAILGAYTHALFVCTLIGQTSWNFFAVATHIFGLVVVVNFYIAFRWSNTRYQGARRHDYSIPPTNVPRSNPTS